MIKKMRKYWSPEQIAGRLKTVYPYDKTKHIGKDSIYKYIYNQRKDLVKYLRCQKGKYRRRYGTRIREKQREELLAHGLERLAVEGAEARVGALRGEPDRDGDVHEPEGDRALPDGAHQ